MKPQRRASEVRMCSGKGTSIRREVEASAASVSVVSVGLPVAGARARLSGM